MRRRSRIRTALAVHIGKGRILNTAGSSFSRIFFLKTMIFRLESIELLVIFGQFLSGQLSEISLKCCERGIPAHITEGFRPVQHKDVSVGMAPGLQVSSKTNPAPNKMPESQVDPPNRYKANAQKQTAAIHASLLKCPTLQRTSCVSPCAYSG